MHPETWIDFPVPDDDEFDEFAWYVSESVTSNIVADLPHEESLSVPSPIHCKPILFKESAPQAAATAVAVEITTEKHPVQSNEMRIVDKSVIEEEPMTDLVMMFASRYMCSYSSSGICFIQITMGGIYLCSDATMQ